MPTYEYACTRCGQHVEVFQRLSEPPLQSCGVCGGPLRKVFHPVGIVFKGSGFYATDSRAKPKAEASDGANDGGQKDKNEKDRNKKDKKEPTGSSSSSSPSGSGSSSPASGAGSGGGSGSGGRSRSGGGGSGAGTSTSGEKTS